MKRLELERKCEFHLCGPHVILKNPGKNLNFWRIDWNGEQWSLELLTIPFPAELIDDCDGDPEADVTVIAETQVLFLWRGKFQGHKSFRNPRAVLRDYLIH